MSDRLKQQVRHAADVLTKALTHPEKGVILDLDLDGVIDENAAFFSTLAKCWPGDVFIVTFRDDRDKAVADLERLGVKYTDLILVNSFAEKADVIARLAIDVYIDDQDEIIRTIPENVTVLKMRNGGNYDAAERKWLYGEMTDRLV